MVPVSKEEAEGNWITNERREEEKGGAGKKWDSHTKRRKQAGIYLPIQADGSSWLQMHQVALAPIPS